LDLVKRIALQPVPTSQPEPQTSPDGTRIAYTNGGIGRGDYSAYSDAVMIMDLALNESTPIFPEENVAARKTIVREFDGYWHNGVASDFLWQPDGAGVLFVAKRAPGEQWWDLHLCLVNLSNGSEAPRIARRRLDFSQLFKKGYGPSESCKYDVKTITWVDPGVVRVAIGGCFFMTSNFIDVPTPDLAAALAPSQASGARLSFELEKDMPGGFAKKGETPWPWVTSISGNGTVHSVMGERISFFSQAQAVELEFRYAVLGSATEATEAASALRSSNEAVKWHQLPQGSAPPCESGGCWSSSAGGLYRLLAQSGSACLLVTGYGRDVLPGEQQVADAAVKERDAGAMAALAVRRIGQLLQEP
jgi:hypothetical protein